MDKFKQLGLAFHNYASAYGSFPPAAQNRDKDGKSGLSWRVHILPFMEENKLYKEFHLDEAWDSPHNIKLLERMPKIYAQSALETASEVSLQTGYTTYVAPLGEGTIAGADKPIKFQHITDGTSNTLLIVEANQDNAVPWTAPQDYEFDPEDPAKGLAVNESGTFTAEMADGSAHQLPRDIDPKTLLHLFQMNDGNPVRF